MEKVGKSSLIKDGEFIFETDPEGFQVLHETRDWLAQFSIKENVQQTEFMLATEITLNSKQFN